MSVRRVSCPGCNSTLNIPATMSHVKCSSCGTVWDVNNPGAAKKPAGKSTASPAADKESKKPRKSNAAKKKQAALIGVASTLVALIAIAGICVVLFSGGGDDTESETTTQNTSSTTQTATVDPLPSFREVKLPESTRKKIYYDYRQAASSSVEKKVFLPKDSKASQILSGTMEKIVDREVTAMAIMHKVKDEDILEIVKEGDAKGWPPLKPKKDTDKP